MKPILRNILFFVIMVGLVACGGQSETATSTTAPSSQSGDSASNRPSAPATDDFRPDPATWVGNTGNPQLVEVFSYD